jgi:hypothetical protein
MAAKLIVVAGLSAILFHVTGLIARPTAPAPPSPPRAVAAAPLAPAAAAEPATGLPASLATMPLPGTDSAFVVKRILTLDGPLKHGDYAWDDKDVPPGPLVITVDLEAETLSVFRGGYEIGVAAVLYGATEKPSPLGTFPITEKDADHVSNLYDAPMPYMLRLTNDGVAIHGSEVAWNRATHGCIGVPVAFAKLLFAQARIGDRVIITKGKMLRMGEAIAAG